MVQEADNPVRVNDGDGDGKAWRVDRSGLFHLSRKCQPLMWIAPGYGDPAMPEETVHERMT